MKPGVPEQGFALTVTLHLDEAGGERFGADLRPLSDVRKQSGLLSA